MKNMIALLTGLMMLTACGKQVGKDLNAPPVFTPSPGTANPPSNPNIVFNGILTFANNVQNCNQNGSNAVYQKCQTQALAPEVTLNYVTLESRWVTIKDVKVQDTSYAANVIVNKITLDNYGQVIGIEPQCTLSRMSNNQGLNYIDSRSSNVNGLITYSKCQIFVGANETISLSFSGSQNGAVIDTNVEIVE